LGDDRWPFHQIFRLIFSAISAIFGAVTTQADAVRPRTDPFGFSRVFLLAFGGASQIQILTTKAQRTTKLHEELCEPWRSFVPSW
jgi:hypothetical protein